MINLLALVLIGAAALGVSVYARTMSGVISTFFMALGALISAVSWFQMRLAERERLEKLEFDELTKSSTSSALFTTGETEVFPAQRSREQFERYFIPGFTTLLFVLQTGAAVLLLRSLQKITPGPIQDPLVCLGLFGMFFLLLFLVGRYSTSLARLEGLRLLRPGATALLLNAYLSLLVLLGVGISWLGFVKADLYLARALACLLFLTGLETLINLVLELYRPRLKGKAERPMYESRLISLLGQPEGLITTAAQTLDYQFGFKVSETWAYQLFARWLPWLVLGQLGVLLLSTTVIFIEPGEQAVLERFGRFETILKPGGHFKFPWPVDHAYRYATEQIQSIDVGFEPATNALAGNTVLWTVQHTKEENFVVANHYSIPVQTEAESTGGAPPVPVSLLTVSIPVQYQITNLVAWVYDNQQPAALLEEIAYREVVRYFVSADLNEIMSKQRGDAARILHERIQAEADRHQLGVNIVFVGLQDIHPPVKVAPDYEKFVSISHTTNANIRLAEAQAIQTRTAAEIQAHRTVVEANSARESLETNAVARVELFRNQIPAFEAAPSVYVRRGYLDTFAQAVANTRTYIILPTNTHNIAIMDLEDKIRPDLLDQVSLPPPAGSQKTNSSGF
jgi:regulator of protease activity HflC (stomatin/prohibitin superfamily)